MNLKPLFAVLRTSEFWVFLGQVAVQAYGAPVPEEFKAAGWVYIAARIVGKVMQYVWPNPTNPQGGFLKSDSVPPAAALILALMLALPGAAIAQNSVPLTSLANRVSVNASGGAIVLTSKADWSGASLGGVVLYNLHPKLSLFYGYDHGFPINNVDKHLDFSRVVGSVKVLPNAFVGFGYGWFGNHVEGGLAQLAIIQPVATRLDLAATYSHVFADQTLDDFEYVKVCLNYHLLGKD